MFKNIQYFRISPSWSTNLVKLERAVAGQRFVPCGPTQDRSIGWVPPRGTETDALVESVGGHWILKYTLETKILPGSVVNTAVKEEIARLEAANGRKPGRKEIRDLKGVIREQLLAKAFAKQVNSIVWIDPESRLLVVEAASKTKADDALSLLIKTVEDFAVSPIETETSPTASMSTWLASQDAPVGFTADQECVLKACDESKATVKYAKHRLDIDEIRSHIAAGKVPTQLAMTWSDRVSFALTDTGAIKKLQFLEGVFEGRSNDTDTDRFDTDVAITTGELGNLIPALIQALGGETLPS